jgi:hypothetical protein
MIIRSFSVPNLNDVLARYPEANERLSTILFEAYKARLAGSSITALKRVAFHALQHMSVVDFFDAVIATLPEEERLKALHINLVVLLDDNKIEEASLLLDKSKYAMDYASTLINFILNYQNSPDRANRDTAILMKQVLNTQQSALLRTITAKRQQ